MAAATGINILVTLPIRHDYGSQLDFILNWWSTLRHDYGSSLNCLSTSGQHYVANLSKWYFSTSIIVKTSANLTKYATRIRHISRLK